MNNRILKIIRANIQEFVKEYGLEQARGKMNRRDSEFKNLHFHIIREIKELDKQRSVNKTEISFFKNHLGGFEFYKYVVFCNLDDYCEEVSVNFHEFLEYQVRDEITY